MYVWLGIHSHGVRAIHDLRALSIGERAGMYMATGYTRPYITKGAYGSGKGCAA